MSDPIYDYSYPPSIFGGGTPPPTPDPAPAITSLFPDTTQPASGAGTILVGGTGFVDGAVASADGAPLTTTFDSERQLSTAYTAPDQPATVQFTVTNPDGQVSNSWPLPVAVTAQAEQTPADEETYADDEEPEEENTE
jgi:hypothetical protein